MSDTTRKFIHLFTLQTDVLVHCEKQLTIDGISKKSEFSKSSNLTLVKAILWSLDVIDTPFI